MKGFPNQVADLEKLARGMRCITELVELGQQAKDDGVLGEAFVRAGVAGTGHRPQPVEDYLRLQRQKKRSNRSHEATARGLRELYRILGFIDDSGDAVRVTDLGRQAAAFAGQAMNEEQMAFWRRAIRNMAHDGGDGEESHPYQVLLHLIARRPRIEKSRLALALEARNNSHEELARIVALAELPQGKIRKAIHTSRTGRRVSWPNWKNAVKVLPKLAEQLGDVVLTGRRGKHRYELADAPGRADAGAAEPRVVAARARLRRPVAPRAPRTSREVTPDTIARAGTGEASDEVEIPPQFDEAAAAAAVQTRRDRVRRHNLLVQKLGTRFAAAGFRLYEEPFDVLALQGEGGVLSEIKTLDGTPDDERDRVRDTLSQLLYYEAFVVRPVAGEVAIRKVACFERRISDDHARWFNEHGIAVIWLEGDALAGDKLAADFLGGYLEEFR